MVCWIVGRSTEMVRAYKLGVRSTGAAIRSGIAATIKALCVILAAVALSGCLGMEGSAPALKRSDLAVRPDYSGTYLGYQLDDKGGIIPALPTEMFFFDRVSEGEYRFASQRASDKVPVFHGFLYLLEVGVEDEVVGILYARNLQGKERVGFLRIRRVGEYRFDVAMFTQTDTEKYELLSKVAHRHGISLDPESKGYILHRPTGGQLRAAYTDPEFLPNVHFDFSTAVVRQDPDAGWPESVAMEDASSVGLPLVEDSPIWRATEIDGHCALEYGPPGGKASMAVHEVRGGYALELLLPDDAASVGERVQLRWQVDTGRSHILFAERTVLEPDVLVSFPFRTSLLEELARGHQLTITARDYPSLRLPLAGSARATVALAQCLKH